MAHSRLSLEEKNKLIQHAMDSLKWTTLGNLLPRFLTPISTFILAGLLTPSDFGVVAIALLVVSLGQILAELGFSQAIIQRQTQVQEASSVGFWVSLIFGVLLYGIVWFGAPVLADLYGVGELKKVLRGAGLSLIVYTLGAMPTAMLMRKLAFRRLFWVTSLPQVIGAIASIIWALHGGGVWALVIGPLLTQTAKTGFVWYAEKWRPSLHFDRDVFGSVLRFSFWVALSGLQTWLFLQADNAIAGFYLGVKNLGLYSFAFNISMLFPVLISSSLSTVAYPTFCTLGDRHEIASNLLKMHRLAAAVMFPLAFGFSAIGGLLFSVVYGQRWEGIGPVIGLLAIMPGLSNMWSLNADAYRAASRPDIWTKVAVLSLLIMFPLLLFLGRYGLIPYTIGRFIGGLTLPIINLFATASIFHVPIKLQVDAICVPLLSSLIMFFAVVASMHYLGPATGLGGVGQLTMIVMLGGIIYCLVLWVMDRRLLWQLWTISRQMVFSR